MNTFYINTAELRDKIPQLRAGDRVYLSGTLYTARDAAHKRIFEMLESGEPLPFEIGGSVIYYAGPTPANGNKSVSFGPTTSSRMDAFAPRLYDMGMLASVGKGDRSDEVNLAVKRNGAVYFCAGGGFGALIGKCITKTVETAFPELGCESVKTLTAENLPLIVGTDCFGNSVFDR